MKETLEEAAKRLYPIEYTGSMFMPNRDELYNSIKQEAFIEGAKWQQERMYTEEEVIEVMQFGRTMTSENTYKAFDRLFKKQ